MFERYLNKKFPPEKEITYKDLYYQIIDYLELEYDELQDIIRSLLNELTKIYLPTKDYIEFMFRLLELEKQGLIDSDIQWKEVIQVEFENSLKQIKGVNHIDNSSLMIPETEYLDLNKMIIEFNNILRFETGNSGQEIVKKWLDLLFEKREEGLNEKWEVRQLTNFFEICNSLDIINNYLLKSNYLLNTFIKYIKESYINVVNKSDSYKHEVNRTAIK